MECFANRIVIAIDGFSSCGKSTFAKRIAARLGYIFIDSGAMYRAVTLAALQSGAISDGRVDADKVIAMLDKIDITFKFNLQREASDIYVNEVLVEDKIRSIEVSSYVSEVSGIGPVRKKLVAIQQKMGECKGIVMDGRDIGTVVFPNAELKIFMTADPRVRAQRRYDELTAKGESVSLDQIIANIESRDVADQTRTISPLRKAEDALVLDNSYMTIDQQMEWVLELLNGFSE